jgi:hypothetical protein
VHTPGPDLCPLPEGRGQTVLSRLTQKVRVTGSGDLLMRLREHSIPKTSEAGAFFPD